MLDVPGHTGIAHEAPCVSHGTGKAEWLLYFTASSQSIFSKNVCALGAFWLLFWKADKVCVSIACQIDPNSTASYSEAAVQSNENLTYDYFCTKQKGF